MFPPGAPTDPPLASHHGQYGAHHSSARMSTTTAADSRMITSVQSRWTRSSDCLDARLTIIHLLLVARGLQQSTLVLVSACRAETATNTPSTIGAATITQVVLSQVQAFWIFRRCRDRYVIANRLLVLLRLAGRRLRWRVQDGIAVTDAIRCTASRAVPPGP